MASLDITKEEAQRLFVAEIVPKMIDDISAQTTRRAYILGGQPGSGKSSFAREIIKTNKNIVFINGDDLRVYHPNYELYLKENDVEAADLTQPVCNFWIESLIQECINRGLDVIVEGTMRKKEVPLKTAQMLRNAGYSVDLVIISAPYEVSLRSLECRYSELRRLGKLARSTKKESHDEAYKNIEGSLSSVIDSHLCDNVSIYKRNRGNFEGYTFNTDHKEDILKIFHEGRSRPVEDRERGNPFTDEITFKM